MYLYAGIDEAGYGPLLGPLVVGRCLMAIPDLPAETRTAPDLWDRLSAAVCKTLTGRKGRIAVNDSKKVHTPAAGLAHLERGVLAFAALTGHQPRTLGDWLAHLGEPRHGSGDLPRWYRLCDEHPWNALPHALTPGELAVSRGMLRTTAAQAGLEVLGLDAAIVFEDQFNQMVQATRSKAATSFTFVAGHLRDLWDRHGQHHPHVAVDRQSGRSHYRELLAQAIPEATITILAQTDTLSAYHLHAPAQNRAMHVSFLVQAEQRHMPVALASMVSKYTRELLMARFNGYFLRHWPQLKPTAGYATDGRRFINEVQPLLPTIDLTASDLCRIA